MLFLTSTRIQTAHNAAANHVRIQQLPDGLPLFPSEVHLDILKGALLAAKGWQDQLVGHFTR